MNKRIRELANEARIEVGQRIGYNDRDRDNAFEEVFAELIVKECAKVCDDLDIDDWGDKSFDDGTYYCSRAIKKHFGVEE